MSGTVWSFLKYLILWQLKYLSLLVAFFFTPFWPSLDILTRSPVILIDYLLINVASADVRICCMSSIILLPCSSIVVIVNWKSLCIKSRVTGIAILSHMSWFAIIAANSCFIKNEISAKILMTGFLKPFGLLIQG